VPSFSIITTCKGRLEHLKQSLPRMLAQEGAEVIVVDWSCPEGTADVVERDYPGARTVRVEGETGFSNWRARNRGAAVATGQFLLFCDADTILADGAIEVIAKVLPARSFGFFSRRSSEQFNKKGERLSNNQLRGFHVIPAQMFRALGGYDEVLEGYAAGGDTDLEERLLRRGFKGHKLGEEIVGEVIEHDNEARFTHHADPIAVSYAAGLLYRRAKLALLGSLNKGNLPLKVRRHLYATARTAAGDIAKGKNTAKLTVKFETRPIGMPRQLGFARGNHSVSLTVRIDMRDPLDAPPA
jgi:glycosyltransferase involved in cell wall biosynthesis